MKNILITNWMRWIPVYVSALVFLVSCEEEKPEANIACNLDLTQLQTSYRSLAQESFSQVSTAFSTASASINQFAQSPSETALATAQNDFIAAYASFQKIQGLDLGTGFTVRNGGFYTPWLNSFPADSSALVDKVNAGNTDLSQFPQNQLGYSAVEFLLFGTGADNAAIASYFSNNSSAATLLINQLAYIQSILDEMSAYWNGDASAFFTESAGTAQGDPLPLLVNAMVKDFETLKNFKLKAPAGRYNGGIPELDLAEGRYANQTINLANAHYDASRALFLDGANNLDLSLIEYVSCVDSDLGTRIQAQFKIVDGFWMQLSDPLSEVVEDDAQFEALNTLINEMQKLTPLIKRELTSELNVQISFQDNDGD